MLDLLADGQNLRDPHIARQQQLFDRYLLPAPDPSSKPAAAAAAAAVYRRDLTDTFN